MLQLIVLDVDGVLSPGEAAPLDFAVLQRLAGYNDRARHDVTCPAITLCTGRPAPYVEVLMQAIHGFSPAVYEHGAGLFIPEPYGFKWHPALTPATQAQLMQLHVALHQALVATGVAYLQPGKSASLSIFSHAGISLQELARQAGRLAREFGNTFRVEVGATCVNIMVRGLDKAAGVRWLARETNIPLRHMAGVGDARGDLKFMRLLGWSAAPANAQASVKQAVHYTSPYENGQGLVDILGRLLSSQTPHAHGNGNQE
jgi:hydroxymethylpyrimidine pyrophosphatase-like HAD family hydrolase